MSFDFTTLVTDRTQSDVQRVRSVAAKIINGTASAAEIAEWNAANLTGAYNYTDLNRVTAAIEALKTALNGYGYAVPGLRPFRVWYEADIPTPELMAAHLANVSAIRSVLDMLPTTPAVPADMERMTTDKANAIERILADINTLIHNMIAAWFYSGEIYSGEV